MSRADGEPSLMDEAARAGWLYYVGGLTQDQIAAELGVSRQRAQRLVSRAMSEGLIRVRLDHKIGACLHQEAELAKRYKLRHCRVGRTRTRGWGMVNSLPATRIAGIVINARTPWRS